VGHACEFALGAVRRLKRWGNRAVRRVKREALAGGLPMHESAALNETGLTDTGSWETLLCQGAQDIFEMTIGVPLRRCAAREAGEFTAVNGLVGPVKGVFAMRCDEKTANGIARAMLEVDKAEAKGEVWDALGEVCTLVIGNFKGKIGMAGESSVLSVPTVIHGHDYRVRPLINGSFLECWMETADGALQFRLDYRLT
jgi:CheY-specific phosphatase CheX